MEEPPPKPLNPPPNPPPKISPKMSPRSTPPKPPPNPGTAAVGSRIVGVYAGKAELIIALAFLRVGKHIVGFVDLFELFLGFFIAGVQVRVVLFGKFAVGALDLGIRGVFADAQHLVIISFFCHMITPLCVEVS